MIGERLLQLRKEANLTQDELAAILKINNSTFPQAFLPENLCIIR